MIACVRPATPPLQLLHRPLVIGEGGLGHVVKIYPPLGTIVPCLNIVLALLAGHTPNSIVQGYRVAGGKGFARVLYAVIHVAKAIRLTLGRRSLIFCHLIHRPHAGIITAPEPLHVRPGVFEVAQCVLILLPRLPGVRRLVEPTFSQGTARYAGLGFSQAHSLSQGRVVCINKQLGIDPTPPQHVHHRGPLGAGRLGGLVVRLLANFLPRHALIHLTHLTHGVGQAGGGCGVERVGAALICPCPPESFLCHWAREVISLIRLASVDTVKSLLAVQMLIRSGLPHHRRPCPFLRRRLREHLPITNRSAGHGATSEGMCPITPGPIHRAQHLGRPTEGVITRCKPNLTEHSPAHARRHGETWGRPRPLTEAHGVGGAADGAARHPARRRQAGIGQPRLVLVVAYNSRDRERRIVPCAVKAEVPLDVDLVGIAVVLAAVVTGREQGDAEYGLAVA